MQATHQATHTPMKVIALASPQGTACAETALYENEDTPAARALIEAEFCTGSADAPVADTWMDVTDNTAIAVTAELLEALEDLLRKFNTHTSSAAKSYCVEQTEKARAAIAKAIGP